MSNIRQTNKNDTDKILNLLHRSFGPGRFTRSVYRPVSYTHLTLPTNREV